jgi:serine protease AprX
MRPTSLRLPLVALALAAALFLVPQAGAGDAYGSKVDSLVATLTENAVKKGENPELQVIVFGRDLPEAAERAGGKARRKLKLVGGESVKIEAKDLDKLAAQDDVTYVAPDLPVVPTGLLSQPSLSTLATFYPQVIGAPTAWNGGLTGAGIGIAVLDSGVAAVPDFGGRLVQVQLPGQTAPAGDAYGHGTFVAGVAAGSSADGRYRGVAPGATVYGLNVSAADGLHTSYVIAGLDWVLANAAQHNIRVVNISLSENVESSYLSSPLDTAVERLWRSGIVVVASSGNRGPGTALYAPGNDPFVITVGSTDSNDTATTTDDTVASFTSSGVTLDGFSKPELLAPGRHIASTLPAATTLAQLAPLQNLIEPGYALISGTSFSAPQVAGAAADLLQQHPSWTPDQVKWLLSQTARTVAGTTAGELDLAAAAAFAASPGFANQGLVPTTYGLSGSTTTDYTSATWNSATWNSATWNSATWNSATWNSATWNAAAWD